MDTVFRRHNENVPQEWTPGGRLTTDGHRGCGDRSKGTDFRKVGPTTRAVATALIYGILVNSALMEINESLTTRGRALFGLISSPARSPPPPVTRPFQPEKITLAKRVPEGVPRMKRPP